MKCLIPFAILGWTLVANRAVPAADPDPVKDKLDTAKALFQAKLEKLNDGVLAGLQKREDAARNAKLDKVVDQIKAERDEFLKKGAVPKSQNPFQFTQSVKQFRGELLVAYDVAIKAYAKDPAKDDVRKAITKERDEVAGEQAAATAGPFHEGSVWTGTYQVNKAKSAECTFEVLDLSATEFTAKIKAKDGTPEFKLKGKYVRGNLEWTVTEVLKGSGSPAGGKATGAIRGNALEAQMTGNDKRVWTFSLKYTPGK